MNKIRSFVAVMGLINVAASVCTADGAGLELTIRTYPREVKLGDPLYVEVAITNRGKEPIVAANPHLDFGTFRFEICDSKRNLIVRHPSGSGGFFGDVGTVKYEPNVTVKHHWYLFVPGLWHLDDKFWKVDDDGGKGLSISGVYRYANERPSESGPELRSKWHDLFVHNRDAEELRVLHRWAWMARPLFFEGPDPTHFGVQLHSALDRERTVRIVNQLEPSELKEMLELIIKLQELYGTPPEVRDEGNRALVEWLSKQPEVKRQALTEKAFSIARSNGMLPGTAELLKGLIEKQR